MELCLHQGCFAAEGRKRSQHCKCPRRHIRIATTIKIHELSMESAAERYLCVRRRASTSAQTVPQPPESARRDEHKFDLRGNGGWVPLVETHPHGKTHF